jgi:DNA helicase-2/ATP-dependent DNA helicase PcrA
LQIKPFAVVSVKTLTAIAEQVPMDEDALAAIPGIGQQKSQQFGPELLAIVRSRVRNR